MSTRANLTDVALAALQFFGIAILLVGWRKGLVRRDELPPTV